MDSVTKSLGYAHHYVVDKLDTATLPGDQSLAAKVLSGLTTDGPLADLLQAETYGCPAIPPPRATILSAVIVLKLVLNQIKQAAM
jgi:hypothetical protein